MKTIRLTVSKTDIELSILNGSCPLKRALERRSDVEWAVVYHHKITARIDGRTVQMPLSDQSAQFVEDFDHHRLVSPSVFGLEFIE